MAVRLTVFCGVLFLSILALGAQNKPAGEKGADSRATGTSGKQTYNHYCAACHGTAARGDGPVAGVLTSPVPDLTTLAKRHGGKFPYDYVTEVLRFGTRFAAHGSSDMPIWGAIFASTDNYDQAAVRKRIKDLADYLASIQEKEL
jgi:mono/diheme cytochrome c family protein